MHQPAQTDSTEAGWNRLIERIKVNQVWREKREGRTYWMKRRRAWALPLLHLANGFFRLASAPMRALPRPREWLNLEVQSFRELHGAEGYRAFSEERRTVGAEELPGINLTIPLDASGLMPEMACAAGIELRRVHGIRSAWYDGPWSHGDAHVGNFIYDAGSRRARMIDFEVTHCRSLSARVRHADDVLIFLQDMLGRIDEPRWLPCAHAFLEGYGEGEITRDALSRLYPPTGIAAHLWWRIRTGWLPQKVLRRRIEKLIDQA